MKSGRALHGFASSILRICCAAIAIADAPWSFIGCGFNTFTPSGYIDFIKKATFFA
ncbi:MAG: hypothetical protein IPQ04_06670 [Saprospiraceae bacterium]|nr:hypothetical protein [Saprospiraceae bacterium]